ncbi:MAG TPA: VWA domain-containing protein [Caulobacteraceae bacterium]|nr:VWA domain-containing protein [Caulobacteraceae bacterium]
MQHTLESFLKALRAHDVRVSPAEAIDAHRAAAEVGYGDRALLKDALCVTLAKSAEEVDQFDACFDTFFARPPAAAPPRPAAGGAAEAPPGSPQLAGQLLAGDEAALAQAMEAAAADVGAGDIRLTSQRNLLTRRMLDAMGLRELEALIQSLRAGGAPRDQALAERLAERRAALFVQAAAFMERQAQLYASESGRRLRDALLARQKLTAVEPEDFRAMEALVRRMARRLATRYARKRHKARKGKLDVRRTIRRSMGHGGVPFDVVWKTETLHKPKIAVLCDVSRSVAAAAQFLLLFLYSLNEVVERLDAFAFSDRLVSVNDLLDDEKVDDAITLVLARVGFRPTDYGRSLADFMDAQGSRLDRRTTVIILGDGRSNYVEPRLDLMRAINDRARAVIWLNPEPETYWGQGDSKMDAYRRFCTVAKTCNTLSDLERIIEDVLRTYRPR